MKVTDVMAELALLIGNVAIHRFPLDKAEIVIGRGAKSDILITDSTVSSQHARLRCTFDKHGQVESVVFEDLESTNGSRINNQPVMTQELLPDDIIRIGATQLKFIHEKPDDTHTDVGDWSHVELRQKLDRLRLDELSSREREVLALLGQGKQRKEIARELNLSVHTVSDHIKAVYRKLNISSRQEAVLLHQYLNS